MRSRYWVWVMLCGGILSCGVGCGQSGSDDYRSYSELNNGEASSADGSPETRQVQTGGDEQETGSTSPMGTSESETIAADTPDDFGRSATPAANSSSSGSETETPLSTVESNGNDGPAVAQIARIANPAIDGVVDPEVPAEAPASPRVPKVLIPENSFKVEGPEGAVRVSYDDLDLLKVLNMDPVTTAAPAMMPDWLKELDGKRIRIRGFMYPPPIEDGIRAFALARDNQICCFGKNPMVYDLFPVFLREGETTHYILNRPFDVVGVFHIKPVAGEDGLDQIYEIDDALVIEK